MKGLRVHLAPVGFEIDRVVIPLVRMKAEKVWLITEKNPDIDKGRPYFEAICKKLDEYKIPYGVMKCGMRDLFEVLYIYRQIIEQEDGNHIYVNVSTGTKIHSIAGMMACMIFKDKTLQRNPYYIEPEDYDVVPNEGQQLSIGCKRIHDLPNYRIQRPDESLIKGLKLIEEASGKIRRKELILRCVEADILEFEKEGISTSAKYVSLDRNVIRPLLSWGFIEIIGEGKRSKIQITDDGRNVLKFLG